MAEKSLIVDYMHGSVPRRPLQAFNRDGRMELDERYQEALSLPPHRPMPGALGPLYRARAPGPYSMPRPGYPGPHPVPRGPGSLGSLATSREFSSGYGPTGPSPGFQGRLSAATPGYHGDPSAPSSALRPGPPSGLPRQDMEGGGGPPAPRLPIPGIEGALSILRGLSVDLSQLRPLLRAPTAHQDPESAPKGHTEPSSLSRGHTEPSSEPSSLSRGHTEPSSLSRGHTEPSSLSKGYTESSSLSRGYTESSSLSKGYTESSSLSKGYTESSSLSKGYMGTSSLSKGYTEPSSLPREYTESSSLPRGYTETSTLPKGYTETSTLPKGYTEPSTLPKGYTEPSTLPKGYTEPSTLPKGYTEPSTLPRGYTEPSTLPRGYTEPSTLPRGYTEASSLPKDNTEASSLPKDNTEASSLPKGNTEPSSLPRDYTEASSLPRDYTEASSLPRDYTEASSLPRDYTEASSLPKGYTKASYLPRGYTEAGYLPRGYTEANSLSREFQDPVSLPRAPMGQPETSSFPRSYQESLSLPTGRTGHQQSSLSSGTTPSYQGSFSASQGMSASQRQSYRDSEEQGQPLLHRGSDQQAPYSRSVTTDPGGANASHLSAQRGPLVTEQGHPYSRLQPSREQTYTQPEHPISTHHVQSHTAVQGQQLSAQGGYAASLEPAANRDSPSGALPTSKVRFQGVEDADLTASRSVPQSPSFPSSLPAHQGPASVRSTYRGLPPAPSVLRAARSEDHEGSSALHTDDLRAGDHYSGPIQIHRNAADVEKRAERPVWSYRRHFRSQSPPSLAASPERRSWRSRSRSPSSPHPRDRSPQRLVRRSRSPHSSSERHRSPQRLPRSRSPHSSSDRYRSPQRLHRSRSPHSSSDRYRSPQRLHRSRSPHSSSDRYRSPQRVPRSGSPPYHSPRRPARRSRSPSPPRYRSTRTNSSRSPPPEGPGHRSPPRRARRSRSRSPYARRPRPRSPQRGPRRSPGPGSPPRRTRSPQREADRNRSRSPRPTRARSPPRRGRLSRSPAPAGHPGRARSPGRGARPRRGPSPRPAARRTRSRSPLPTDPSAAQEGEDSEAAAHAGRGISPAYRMASRLGDSGSPPKSRRGRGGMLHPPGSRNTWASQHPRNLQNSTMASSPPSKQPPKLKPLMEETLSKQPSKLQPLMEETLSKQPRNPQNSKVAPSPPSKQPLQEEAPSKQPPKLQPLMEEQPRNPQNSKVAPSPPSKQPLQPLVKEEAPSKQPRPPGALQPPKLRPLLKEEAPAAAGPGRPPRPLLPPRPAVPGRGKSASPSTKQDTEAEQPQAEGRPQKHCGVRIEPFPARSSDKDISFAAFRVFKNFGFVTSIEIHGEGEGRFCLLFYRDSVGRDRAIEAGPRLEVLRQDVSVAAYDGPETESNVVFRPHAGKGAATKTLMQFSKNATKTLFIKNLDSSLARGDLHLTFQAFGRILELNIKRKFNEPTSLAFIQYSDTLSVTRAIKGMHGAQLGETTVLLSYAKPEPTNCVWIDGLRGVTQAYLHKLCLHYGPVALAALDTVHNKALVFFYELAHAQNAVNAIKGQRLAGCFVAVDYANYECQTDFYCAMHSTEQDVAALYEYLMGEQ